MTYPILPLLNAIAPGWVAEHRFHPPRRWKFDFANPALKVAIEVDGGCWIGGRHSRGSGQTKDMEKGNQACVDGWFVCHFTPQHIKDGTLVTIMRQLIEALP
jgi:very-short-patch-repair endonuclease